MLLTKVLKHSIQNSAKLQNTETETRKTKT